MQRIENKNKYSYPIIYIIVHCLYNCLYKQDMGKQTAATD